MLRTWIEEQDSLKGRTQPDLRWIRVNRLRSCLSEVLDTDFAEFKRLPTYQEISATTNPKSYVCDANVPDLICTNASTKELTDSQLYLSGKIILQDKASCFPAHLLLDSRPAALHGSADFVVHDVMDACAAPGNKTSHVASILASSQEHSDNSTAYACERDERRSQVLTDMLRRAAAERVQVLPKQDFLALSPSDTRFRKVTHLLLDPSCSGSGILSREEVPSLTLPKGATLSRASSAQTRQRATDSSQSKSRSKKRKKDADATQHDDTVARPATQNHLQDRLRRLSNLQTHIIEHAFKFPQARVITYSTCSVYATENEIVALRALNSDIARERRWRPLKRSEQPRGLEIWPHRGLDLSDHEENQDEGRKLWLRLTPDEREGFREACIRCKPGHDGTIGFFVVGFVQSDFVDLDSGTLLHSEQVQDTAAVQSDEEWNGFGDDE